MHYVGLDDWCPMKNIGLNLIHCWLFFEFFFEFNNCKEFWEHVRIKLNVLSCLWKDTANLELNFKKQYNVSKDRFQF